MTPITNSDVAARARQSLGASEEAIYRTVADVLARRGASGLVADVGCGSGRLWSYIAPRFGGCIGIDAVRYDDLPPAVQFHEADLDAGTLPVAPGAVDAALAVETIEHLENPRAFVRALARITRPGGVVVITTPNQLSLLSLLTLAARGRFSAFQENTYPAHLTALLEVDLRRIAAEAGLVDVQIDFTRSGRLPLTRRHYPRIVSTVFPRACSDNIVMSAVRGPA
ncbi:MAG TPA: class I SAM-dependent methyltransferase [Vicinamibacterales bacterium]|nr:class I SAM-dependent methyltransferase [Vicinamibacterales bacterium]